MLEPDIFAVAKALLGDWQDAICRRDFRRIGELFTYDALFLATRPDPIFGRKGIVAYYEAVPAGLEANAELLLACAHGAAEGRAVAEVAFATPAGKLRGRLTLALRREAQGAWQIALYHAALT